MLTALIYYFCIFELLKFVHLVSKYVKFYNESGIKNEVANDKYSGLFNFPDLALLRTPSPWLYILIYLIVILKQLRFLAQNIF